MRWLRRRAVPPGRRTPRSGGEAVRRALLAVLARDFGRAEELLAHTVRRDSEDVEAYLALARVYRQQGEIGRAIHVHQNLLLRRDLAEPLRREALAELGADFRQGGFLRRAIATYEEVLEQDGRQLEALASLARLYRDVREFEKAIEMERRLARLEGRDVGALEAELWAEVAETARGDGRAADARRALKRALRRDGKCVRAWVALGDVESDRGRPKAALRAWQRVPQLDRRAAIAVYPRVESAFATLGRDAEHETWLAGLIESDPDDPGARLARVRRLAARGAPDEAVAEARRLLERHPEHLETHGTLGRILLAEHRDGEAVKEYAEFLEALERAGVLLPRESTR